MSPRVRIAIYTAIVAIAIAAGFIVGRVTAPVCHAVTEDSLITDCDYRNGGWRP